MTIELISEDEYSELLDIQKKHNPLTFQNEGYQYINKEKLSPEEVGAHKKVTEILNEHIVGFHEFNNFYIGKRTGEIMVRFQYDWNADDEKEDRPFIGVEYLSLNELLKGFIQ